MHIIGHLDMDAFFAAVEEHDNPRFSGLPIVVGAEPLSGKGRGVVSTANYKAREYGIHSAMPISKAWQLSENARGQGKPAAVFLPGNFRRYEEVSLKIFEILKRYAKVMEEASIDEAYFDLSGEGSCERAKQVCLEIKKEIKKIEGLTASIGIGPNKLIAKIASDFKKPDGLTAITEKEVEAFLEPLPIRKIPGIGPKTEILFAKQGVKIVRDLKKYSEAHLAQLLGKWGLDLYEKIRGEDNTPLAENYEAKSIGEQETFLHDTLKSIFIFERLKILCQNVFARFAQSGFKEFCTVALTVRFANFETKSRMRTLTNSAKSQKILEQEAIKLILPFLDKRANPKLLPIRLIGLRIEKLL